MMETDIDLGPCCACEGLDEVHNIVMLNVKGTQPGCGWGCVECGLPCDGAVVVLCNSCFDRHVKPRFAVDGYVVNKQRIPIGELTVPHMHDLKKHYAVRSMCWN